MVIILVVETAIVAILPIGLILCLYALLPAAILTRVLGCVVDRRRAVTIVNSVLLNLLLFGVLFFLGFCISSLYEPDSWWLTARDHIDSSLDSWSRFTEEASLFKSILLSPYVLLLACARAVFYILTTHLSIPLATALTLWGAATYVMLFGWPLIFASEGEREYYRYSQILSHRPEEKR
jgi:hypothetical protein